MSTACSGGLQNRTPDEEGLMESSFHSTRDLNFRTHSRVDFITTYATRLDSITQVMTHRRHTPLTREIAISKSVVGSPDHFFSVISLTDLSCLTPHDAPFTTMNRCHHHTTPDDTTSLTLHSSWHLHPLNFRSRKFKFCFLFDIYRVCVVCVRY